MATKDKQYGSAMVSREEPKKTTVVAPVKTASVRPVAIAEAAPLRRPAETVVALPFGRQNYTLMLIGIGVILAGFFIMSLDKEEFGFGFLGLTLGPIVVMSGFVLEFFAILARPKSKEVV